MVFQNCGPGVQVLAVIGAVAIYLCIGALVGYLIAQILRDDESKDPLMFLAIVFWPIAIVGGIIYLIGMWILFPLFGATRREVQEEVSRLDDRIDEQCSTPLDLSGDAEAQASVPAFKAGDVVTGIIPQTDRAGNNIAYKRLYQGCKCRVTRIDDNGSMRVVLLDHKDKEAHRSSIGKTFTVPARNFTLVKKPVKKRKAVKAKKSKRSRR